jgi:eukaryotic-like serine/threonine-protein kinase
MKKHKKNFWKPIFVILILIFGFVLILDFIILPLYVSGSETTVPKVVGMNKDEAWKILENANLNPIIQTTRYDEKYKRNEVVFQKPDGGSIVKENRRVYLIVSGGEPLVRVPFLINKTIRDAQISLAAVGLILGQIDSVESEFPFNTIVEQQYSQGRELAKGMRVGVTISVGPKAGMVRVPNILGRSLNEVEIILKNLSLQLGRRTLRYSTHLLPNTILEQEPSENALVKIGDSIHVIITSSKIGD